MLDLVWPIRTVLPQKKRVLYPSRSFPSRSLCTSLCLKHFDISYFIYINMSFVSWRSFCNDLFSSDVSKIAIHIWALAAWCFFCFQDVDHFFRVFSTMAGSGGSVILAFPSEPGAELPVCAGLPCARVGHRFLLWLGLGMRRIVGSLNLLGRDADMLCLVACGLRNLEIIYYFRMFQRFLGQKEYHPSIISI